MKFSDSMKDFQIREKILIVELSTVWKPRNLYVEKFFFQNWRVSEYRLKQKCGS